LGEERERGEVSPSRFRREEVTDGRSANECVSMVVVKVTFEEDVVKGVAFKKWGRGWCVSESIGYSPILYLLSSRILGNVNKTILLLCLTEKNSADDSVFPNCLCTSLPLNISILKLQDYHRQLVLVVVCRLVRVPFFESLFLSRVKAVHCASAPRVPINTAICD
jgi:hypothetical protein